MFSLSLFKERSTLLQTHLVPELLSEKSDLRSHPLIESQKTGRRPESKCNQAEVETTTLMQEDGVKRNHLKFCSHSAFLFFFLSYSTVRHSEFEEHALWELNFPRGNQTVIGRGGPISNGL